MTRRFNRKQKGALFVAANGQCELCGKPLEPGWHGDHIQPWIAGGQTDVINGQALCPECNLKKGDRMPFALRECQNQFVERAISAAKQGQKVFVANLAPGAGKSLAGLCAADRLMALGIIDTLFWAVPRKNLGNQVELEWLKHRDILPWKRTMGDIDFRDNTPPLIRGSASGYVTTYASLVTQRKSPLNIHKHALAGRRVMMFLDEAQQLGISPAYVGLEETIDGLSSERFATYSAEMCEQLGAAAIMIVIATGTPTRTDGSPLLFAEKHYSAPDEDGWCKLNADVELTYRDGVAQRFLRPYQANLLEGLIDWHKLGETTQLRTTEMDRNVYQALQDETYRHKLIDHFVDVVKDQKARVSPIMAGLHVGYRIGDVREFERYMKHRHGNLRVVCAVSDNLREAKTELDRFREDPDYADILSTVGMAFMGYDARHISTICLLTANRTDPFLDQLSARAMRMSPDIDPDLQWRQIVAPDDPRMRDWSARKRAESEAGMFLRAPLGSDGSRSQGPRQEELGWADNGQVINTSAIGYYEKGDIGDTEELTTFEQLRKKYALPSPATQLKAIFQDFMESKVNPKPSQPIGNSTPLLKKEQEKELRDWIAGRCKDCDARWRSPIEKPDWGSTITELKGVYGWQGVDEADLEGLEARKQTIIRWMNQGHSDGKK